MDDTQQPNAQVFKDFIPEGQDQGAYVDGKYEDFVPAPEPRPQTTIPDPSPADVVEEPENQAPVAPKKGTRGRR